MVAFMAINPTPVFRDIADPDFVTISSPISVKNPAPPNPPPDVTRLCGIAIPGCVSIGFR
jgi:hypothetical protein